MIVYRMSTPLSRKPAPTFYSEGELKAYYLEHFYWSEWEVNHHEIIEEETGIQKLTEVAE